MNEGRAGLLFPSAIFCATLTWCLGVPSVKTVAAESNQQMLIVTGEDYPGHKWKQTTPVLQQLLAPTPSLRIDVLQDLSKLATTRLGSYRAVVLHFKNYDPDVPGRAGLDNLSRYVEQGGGLVLVHFACGAFQEFKDDFEKLAGRVWDPELRGHDPRGKFRVEIAASDHPITRGMKSFVTDDELYTCLAGTVPVTVLATAVSKVDGKTYPIAFVRACGPGRVFHCLLGHDVSALSNPDVAELFWRGTAWASRLKLEEQP